MRILICLALVGCGQHTNLAAHNTVSVSSPVNLSNGSTLTPAHPITQMCGVDNPTTLSNQAISATDAMGNTFQPGTVIALVANVAGCHNVVVPDSAGVGVETPGGASITISSVPEFFIRTSTRWVYVGYQL